MMWPLAKITGVQTRAQKPFGRIVEMAYPGVKDAFYREETNQIHAKSALNHRTFCFIGSSKLTPLLQETLKTNSYFSKCVPSVTIGSRRKTQPKRKRLQRQTEKHQQRRKMRILIKKRIMMTKQVIAALNKKKTKLMRKLLRKRRSCILIFSQRL